MKVSNTPEQLQTMIETIISTPTGNDFVNFEIKDISYFLGKQKIKAKRQGEMLLPAAVVN